jgi:hypothetical protein
MLNPTSLTSDDVTAGTSPAAQTVTITNAGNSNDLADHLERSGIQDERRKRARYTHPATDSHTVCSIRSDGGGHRKRKRFDREQRNSFTCDSPPTGTGIAPVQHSVTLTWNATTSTVAGYNVYRGTVSGGRMRRSTPRSSPPSDQAKSPARDNRPHVDVPITPKWDPGRSSNHALDGGPFGSFGWGD